ncbi:MFS transporter [Pendulispora albinea]|uniref:MFS transporter n=2 Tax=Pendulispora albinea TaxID=2741071 RepID=A0ABZ2LYJ7_9BACT
MRRPSLGAIFLTVFLDLLGFGLVIPFLAEEARDNFHTTALVGTLLSAVYSLMQFLFVPVWGRLSDRVGRRPVLVWSVAANVLTMLGLGLGIAYGNHVGWLFAARMFGGIATANLGTASAYIADVTKPEERARGMGMIGMAFGLGFVLGPGFGGVLAKITINGHTGAVTCFAAAALGVINFVWVLLGLAESLPKEKRAAKPVRSLSPLNVEAAKRAFGDNSIFAGILVNFLIVFSFTNMEQTFRYYNKDVFWMDQLQSGLLLAAIGVTAALVQGGLMRPLTKRYSEPTLIPVGVMVQAVAFFGLVFAPSAGKGLLYASSLLLAVGNGITQPTVSSYVSRRASATEQGAILGTNQSAASLARVIGPACGGFVYGAYGPRSPYITATIGMLIALTCTIALARDQKTSTQMS